MIPRIPASTGVVEGLRRNRTLRSAVLFCLLPGLTFWSPLQANPRGGSIVHGNVNIGAGAGGNLQIRQTSNSAIINWDSFSIDAGELTQFRQPNSNSAVLNRVTGGDPSAIHGALRGNGNVFVINPNGILVGAGGTIDVHGLVLSTLDVENGEFLAGGDMSFKGVGENVTNMGRINGIGGDVFLIGRTVRNSGTISASSGTVGLAAGEEVLLTASGNTGERLFVRAKGAGVSGTGILNDGTIEGAAVELKAHGNMFALAINNKGSIRATGATTSGGKVYLRGAGGSVNNSGSIRATGSGVGSGGRILIEAAYAKVDGMMRAERGNVRIAGTEKVDLGGTIDVSTSTGKGGAVVIEGADIQVADTTLINASGEIGGGNIQIGGGFQGKDSSIVNAGRVVINDGALLRSDALVSGAGGNVIVWSDGETRFSGGLSATGIERGGFAEISGKNDLEVSGTVDLTARSGIAGTLLLDPTNITISSLGSTGLGGSTISNVWLSQQLDMGNNVVVSTNFGGGVDAGNITIGRTDTTLNAATDRIQWYQNSAAVNGGTLSLLATGNILFNTAVQSAGQGGINVVAGWDGTTGWSGAGSGAVGGPITFNIGAVMATINDGNALNDAAGLNGGSVFVGATNSRLGVTVGSRWGATNVVGRDLVLRGSTTIGHGWAQLGFTDNGVEYQLSRSQNGVILNEWWGSTAGNVQAKNYIALLGGTEFGTGDTGALGTKAFRGAGWGATGNITAAMSGRVDVRGGTTSSYTQIGHGGILKDGSEDKWLTGQPARITRDGIQIDSGGVNRFSIFSSTWRTNYAGNLARIDGDISVTAGADILILGQQGFDAATDDLDTNVTDGSYTMIGHGGLENQGSYHGNISVIAHGVTATPTAGVNNGLAGLGIQVLSGRGTRDFAMIGHGSGYEGNPRTIWDQSRSGDITVTATTGAIRVQAHNQAVRVGTSNATLNTGAIYDDLTPAELNNASDASNLGSFVQIGHGGQNSTLQSAAGTFIMPGGTNVTTIMPDGSMTGEITVTAGGTFLDPTNATTPIGILLRAGNRRWQHALIGHGGASHNAINTTVQTPAFGTGANLPFGTPAIAASTGFNGNVKVDAAKGSIIASGGDSFRPDRAWGYGYNFAKIGHGGDTVRGPKGGTITILAGQGAGAISGDILFTAGRMQRDFAMIGHGGLDSDGAIDGPANSARILVTARGDINFTSPVGGTSDALNLSPDYAYWWFSNGSANGTPQTGNANWVTPDRFVQLGHGGYASTTLMANPQDITVISGTGDLRNADGNVATGGITFVAGDTDRSYAQLGHGGHSATASTAAGFSGDITVTANGGALTFDGRVIGAQSSNRVLDVSLNGINLAFPVANGVAGNVAVIRGQGGGAEAYAQLGHGGYSARGVNVGNITINTWGGVDFAAAPVSATIARTVTAAPINAALGAGTNVWVALGDLVDSVAPASSLYRYKMPQQYSNVVPGSVRIVLSNGGVITDLPNASSDDQISNLVLNGTTVIGNINYNNGLVRFQVGGVAGPVVPGLTTEAVATFKTAQGLKERAYVQLGHGGYDADGPNNKANDLPSNAGDITVNAGGDIRFQGGASHRSYAQLGNGGYDTKGYSSGNITIDSVDANHKVGGIRFLAGVGGYRQFDYQSYAQLGHGGFEADGNHFGNIRIRGTQDADDMGLLFKAGNRQDAYVQLGHGGYNARSGIITPTRTPFGMNGNIDIQVTGDVAFVAGTMTNNNPLYREDGRLYAQLGHGGYDADALSDGSSFLGQGPTNPSLPVGTFGAGDGSWGHFGDITLTSINGNISFMGGSNIPVANRLDFDGNPIAVTSDPNGFLTGNGGGNGRIHWAQIGHGGYSASGDHHGNITVKAQNGSINLVGGMMSNDDSAEKYNWSQIGHGGGEAQGHLGRANETIRVQAGGNISLIAGQGNRNQAHIGNGGLNFDGSHSGTIQVYAGGDLLLRGGIADKRVVRRIGEFQDMIGVDGGAANDVGEFNGYYGSGGLGYLPMDEAAFAGGGQKTKLIGEEIQPGTVEFRRAIAAPTLFNAAQTPDFVDDSNGNIVMFGTATVVGTINYATGEIAWITKILTTDNDGQPDLFINYEHRTGIRNDALYANATIGHGGYAVNSLAGAVPGGGINKGIDGAIDVRAGVNGLGAFNGSGGSITAYAGNDQRTYVQIGHGGMDSTAPVGHALSGQITVKADGGIVFRGGGGLRDNQHVAFNYYGPAGTEVAAVTVASDLDRVSTRYATPLGVGTRSNSGMSDILYAFAHIGHGGVSVNANNALDNNISNPLAATLDPTTGHNGNILVETAVGNIDFTGGGVTGNYHFAMIGHGGVSSLGNHFGAVEVISGADINFKGGGNSFRSGASGAEGRSFVQIGHGGYGLTGNLEGEIKVSSKGAINFSGGDIQSNRQAVAYGAHVHVLNFFGNQDDNHYNRTDMRQTPAMIGHGGTSVYGDKTGNIFVTAGNGVNFRGGDRLEGSLDNNAGYLSFAQIGHGGNQAWRQYRVNNTTPALPATAGASDDWNLPFWWDGTQYVFDGTFGPAGDGQFFWSVDNSINAAVGLGAPLNDGFSGNITVVATGGDVRFTSGTGMGAFSRIGHGGVETAGDHNGEITVRALAGDIDFNANRIEMTGSTSTASNAFVQIGHGGGYSSGEQSGKIDVSATGKVTFKGGRADNFAMIGHGGRESHGTVNGQVSGSTTYRRSTNYLLSANTIYRPGTRSGDISVTAGLDIAFAGGNLNGDRAFAQIGHGGFNIHANPDPNSQFGDGHSGAIQVISTGGAILLQSGQATSAHVQIGHGGTQSFGNHGGDGSDNRLDSDILVQAVTGIEAKAQGRFSTNTTSANFVQIGHGGRQSSFRDAEDIDAALYAKLQPYTGYTNPKTGLVNVDNGGMHPLTPFLNNTNIDGSEGLGIGARATLGTFMGDITVRTTGVGADIRFIAPNAADGTLGINGYDSSVLLGHGGFRVFGDIKGNITVESGGALEFTALQGTALAPNVNTNHQGAFAQLGHGGYESGGTYTGDIRVTTAGSIKFTGADSSNSANGGYAQLGHGGYNTYKGTTQYREAIRHIVTGVIPPILLLGGSTGKITVNSGGDIEFFAGRDAQNHAQLGHGGYVSKDSHTGDIEVTAAGGISFMGGVDYLDTDPRANIGSTDQAFAMLGHGGNDSDGTHSGNITVSAGQFAAGHVEAGQGVLFRGGAGVSNFAQLGHGGLNSRTYGAAGAEQGLSGNISVSALGDITFVAGTGNYFNSDENGQNYAQLGHGGYDVDVTQAGTHLRGNGIGHIGSIKVTSSGGRIFFGAGDATRADQPSVGLGEGRFHYAQLGHGGYAADGDHSGKVTVSAASDVIFLGGSSQDNDADRVNYAQLGHGGRSSVGDHGRATDLTSVKAGRDIIFRAGNSQDSSAQLGNGGREARGDHRGDIQVMAGRTVEFSAAQGNLIVRNEEKLFDLTRASEFGTQTDDAVYTMENSDVIPGTVVINIPNGPILGDNGSGKIVVTGGNPLALVALGLVIGDTVGTITYGPAASANGVITFTRDVNPNNQASPAVALLSTVSYESKDIHNSWAQLGHGGYEADNPDGNTDLGNSGDIRVTALTGDIIGRGGFGLNTYAQFGHGGYGNRGANSGDVILRAGNNVEFTAQGIVDRSYVQVGHGGWDADGNHSGNVVVSAGSGNLPTHLGTGLFDDLGDFDGDSAPDQIQFAAVGAGVGTVKLTGGSAIYSWVQVGHGGRSSGNTAANASTMTGKVGVAANGAIILQGGTATQTFTQIGHGGWEDGTINMTLGGDISVISQTGKLSVLAGAGSEAYALVGHGSLRNTDATVPLGTRSGSIYIEAANWQITPVGTTSLARIGHRSQSVNNGLTAGNQFSLIGNGGDGTTSYLVNAATVALMGAQDHLAAGGGATFGALGDLVMDLPLNYNSAGTVNVIATGDVDIVRGIQNAGTGAVNVVAGWDGITPSLDFLDKVPMRVVNIAGIYADPTAWGNNGAVATIGGGTQTSPVAVGTAGGTTTVLGDAVEVIGSNVAGNGYALVGFAPASGVSPSGNILVVAKEGGVSVLGGNSSNAYAQIGHRALGNLVSNLSGAITVISEGDLTARGGSALQTSAQIGHGGPGANPASLSGAVRVTVANDLTMTGGSGSVAYTQIGHGGSATSGNMSGSIDVAAGGDITLSAPNLANLSYAKIGHGDDLRGASASTAGTGNRSGNIKVAAGNDLSLTGSMIGHVNNLSPAVAVSGATRIGVSRIDPTDPAGGDLIADAASQFQGADEMRFYLPRRGNNQIAVGALINGAAWNGAPTDPSPVQRIDEYTIHIIGNPSSTPNEHTNIIGSGPAPANAAGFAFYYDTIVMGPAPFVPTVPTTPTNPTPPTPPTPPLPPVPPAPDYPSFFPDDRTTDDWQREQEEYYSGFGDVYFYYEGFDQYGYFGESIFSVQYGNILDSTLSTLSADEDDVLRRHLRLLREAAEREAAEAAGAE